MIPISKQTAEILQSALVGKIRELEEIVADDRRYATEMVDPMIRADLARWVANGEASLAALRAAEAELVKAIRECGA